MLQLTEENKTDLTDTVLLCLIIELVPPPLRLQQTSKFSVLFAMVAVTFILSIFGTAVQSAVRGLIVKVITSGRSATFSCALAVCLTDPVVNPHSYVPAGNMKANLH